MENLPAAIMGTWLIGVRGIFGLPLNQLVSKHHHAQGRKTTGPATPHSHQLSLRDAAILNYAVALLQAALKVGKSKKAMKKGGASKTKKAMKKGGTKTKKATKKGKLWAAK